MNLLVRALAPTALIVFFSQDVAACQGVGEPEVRLRIYSPLVALEHGASTDLAIDAAGCVKAQFPAFDVRHGAHSFRLAPGEMATLRATLRDSGLHRIDLRQLKSGLEAEAKFAAPQVEYVVTDGDIMHLEFDAPATKAPTRQRVSVQWDNLDADLKNHPYSRELKAIERIRVRLLDLGSDARLVREVQP